MVGVNDFTEGSEESDVEILKIGPELEQKQRARLAELRTRRDDAAVERARLDAGLPEDQVLATSAKTREGIPDLLASVEALLTEG